MGKKASTVENRVYLFRDLAMAWVEGYGDMLSAEDDVMRQRGRDALAELAYVSCVMSDTGSLDAKAVAALVRKGPKK